MILVTHAVVGGALGMAIQNPAVAFAAGFLSHFLMDMIPHWDYHLASGREDSGGNHLNDDILINRQFIGDLIKIGIDFSGGILLAYLLFNGDGGLNWSVLLGAIGGTFPDFLQFLYYKLRSKPLTLLQKFHIWIHTDKTFKGRPLLGVPMQIGIILIFWYLGVHFLK